MKIAADTNVLVRSITGGDATQSKIARTELQKAELAVLALPSLCELVWVLSLGYKIARPTSRRRSAASPAPPTSR